MKKLLGVSLVLFGMSHLAHAQNVQQQMQQAQTVAQQFIGLSQNARAYMNKTQQPVPADWPALSKTGIFPPGMVSYDGAKNAAGGGIEFLGVPDAGVLQSPANPAQGGQGSAGFKPPVPQAPPKPQTPAPAPADVKFTPTKFILNFNRLPSLSCVATVNSIAIDRATMNRLGIETVTINARPINVPIDTTVVRNLCAQNATIGAIVHK